MFLTQFSQAFRERLHWLDIFIKRIAILPFYLLRWFSFRILFFWMGFLYNETYIIL